MGGKGFQRLPVLPPGLLCYDGSSSRPRTQWGGRGCHSTATYVHPDHMFWELGKQTQVAFTSDGLKNTEFSCLHPSKKAWRSPDEKGRLPLGLPREQSLYWALYE